MAMCINQKKESCLEKSDSDQTRNEITSNAVRYVATEAYYCKNGMLHSFGSGTIPGCSKKFYRKAKKCANKFYVVFRSQRTSPGLCRCVVKELVLGRVEGGGWRGGAINN